MADSQYGPGFNAADPFNSYAYGQGGQAPAPNNPMAASTTPAQSTYSYNTGTPGVLDPGNNQSWYGNLGVLGGSAGFGNLGNGFGSGAPQAPMLPPNSRPTGYGTSQGGRPTYPYSLSPDILQLLGGYNSASLSTGGDNLTGPYQLQSGPMASPTINGTSGGSYNFAHNQALNGGGYNASDPYTADPNAPMPTYNQGVSVSVPGGSRTASDPTRNVSTGPVPNNPQAPPATGGSTTTPTPTQYNQWTVPTGPLAGTPFVNTTLGNNTIGPFQQPVGGWDARNVLQQQMQDPGWVNSWVNSASMALDPATGLPQMSANPGLPQVQLGQAGLPALLSGTGGALAGVGAPPQATLPKDYAQQYQAASTGINQSPTSTSLTPEQQWQASIWNTMLPQWMTAIGLGGMASPNSGYGVTKTPLGYTQYQPTTTNAQASGLDGNTLALLSALFGGQSRNTPTNGLSALLGLLGGL